MAFSDELGGDGTENEWWAPTIGGELACRGLWACQAARTHLYDHPSDLAGARVIASGYCGAGRCADGWFWNDLGDTMLTGATTVGALFGSTVTTQMGIQPAGSPGAVLDDVAGAATRASRGERLLTNRWVGVESRLLGHSYARGVPGVFNRPGSSFKVGWTSSGEFGGGMHLPIGLGRSAVNPNRALKHFDVGFSHVPNAVADPIVAGNRASRGLS